MCILSSSGVLITQSSCVGRHSVRKGKSSFLEVTQQNSVLKPHGYWAPGPVACASCGLTGLTPSSTGGRKSSAPD